MSRISLGESVRTATRDYLARVRDSLTRLRIRPEASRNISDAWIHADGVRICWFVQTYRDLARLRRTLASLRKHYHESHVLVVSDGDPDVRIEQACSRYSAALTLRPRLFGVERGGEPVQQMLEAFLQTDADALIKIDPDTHVRRRFSVMPSRHDASLYGTVQSSGPDSNRIVSLQGGCIIIPRQAAILLARSKLLQSERLKPPALEWAASGGPAARLTSGLTSYDWTLGWACRELGLLSKDHPEVFSRYQPSLMDTVTERRVAVSHPRFEIRQLTNHRYYFRGLRAAAAQAMSREEAATNA